jgi:hypothetical protein
MTFTYHRDAFRETIPAKVYIVMAIPITFFLARNRTWVLISEWQPIKGCVSGFQGDIL